MMPATVADVHLSLPARAENVAVVRHVLGAFADTMALPRTQLEDMRLAVTEACTNVVRHAYDGAAGRGTMDVMLRPRSDRLEIEVADDGQGIGASVDEAGPGFGLPMMATLADELEIERSGGAGTRVSMTFCRRGAA